MAFRWTQQRKQADKQADKQAEGRYPAFGGRPSTDDIFDMYVEWRQAAAGAASAYHRWLKAPREQVHQWFHAYSAALDQEDAAARTYAEALADGQRRLSGTAWV